MSNKQLQVSAVLEAPPSHVFALLADPARHTELDGSGMLRELEEGPNPVTGVADVFVVAMHQDALGDYRLRNEVTVFEPDRAIAWAPDIHPRTAPAEIFGDLDPCGQQYVWELEPAPGGGTRVTHTYDWSRLRDPSAEQPYPVVTEDQLRDTLERLARTVTE